MSASETPFPEITDIAPATPGGEPVRASLERQLHILGDLAEAGLMMAQAVAREAGGLQAGQSSSRAVADLALAYERVARAVRYAAMLQSRLIGELRAWEQARSSPAAMAAWKARAEREAQAEVEVAARKAEVAGVLERVVAEAQAGQPETERRETLGREAAERLRGDPRLNDILTLPISAVIELICRDLGVQPDWLRLSEEEWARGELRSGKVGAALAAAVLSGAPPDDPSAEAGGRRAPLSRPSWRPPLRAAEAPRRRRAAG